MARTFIYPNCLEAKNDPSIKAEVILSVRPIREAIAEPG
jgi:hypothetical protein